MGKQRQFTLIELLVVIAVIIILIGIALPAYRIALIKAREGQAKFQIKELQTAITSYKAQYQFLPFYPANKATYPDLLVGGSDVTDTPTVTTAWSDTEYNGLLTTLRGTSSILNPRQLEFLGRSSQTYLDPWGNEFYIAFDLDGDNTIGSNKLPGTSTSVSSDMAIWSKGRDGAHNLTVDDDSNDDNLKSWTE